MAARPRGRPKKDSIPPPLNFYGLRELGLGELIPLSGDRDSDQYLIETVAFRIGHRRREGGLGKFEHFKRMVDLVLNNPRRPVPTGFVWCRESIATIRACCEHDELGVAGPSSLGKSAPLALWVTFNFVADPTHIKGLVMSTSIKMAAQRIWKYIREFLSALPNYAAKPLFGTHRILGPNYEETDYGESSGIFLMAGEKGREKDALDNLVGLKIPRTGKPNVSYEALKKRPEFQDKGLDLPEHEREDLLNRLLNVARDRPGKVIFVVDEATGIVESVLNAYLTNLKPGNPGRIQIIMTANPNSHWDAFGLFCEPDVGWDHVTLRDYSWPTKTGGWVIRFSAEESSLIKDKNKECSWMMGQSELDDIAKKFGKRSLYYFRFVLGFWSPEGSEAGVYSQGDVEKGMGEAPAWGFERPTLHSTLDPSFAAGGDKASVSIFQYGKDMNGNRHAHLVEQVPIHIDADSETPVPYQVLRKWKKDCIKRGIPPSRAAFDSSGGGVVFAGIVKVEWSGAVQGISSGGKATARPVGSEKDEQGKVLKASQRFSTRATEIWYGAHPFLRSRQISGITTSLGKEICSRRHTDKKGGDGRSVQIEDKRTYKKREGSSPDDSDSFFLGIEHLRTKYGFKPTERAGGTEPAVRGAKVNSPWEAFKKRARGISVKTNLPRG